MGDAADATLDMQKLFVERDEAGRTGSLGLMQIEEALHDAVMRAASQQRQVYLLVDTAHAEGTHLSLERWQIPYVSLFENTPEQSLLDIAPLLVDLARTNADQRAKLLSLAQELAYAAPCISWFEADASIQRIAEHLRLFHTVDLSEGQAMLMRWYDTRILPVWLACLTEQQSGAFSACIHRWQYVDRSGDIASLPLKKCLPAFPAEGPYGRALISLTDQQYGLLIDAAQLDILLKHLQRIIPDEVGRLPRAVLMPAVARFRQEAADAGLDDLDRQTQYVLVGLYTCGQGLKHRDFENYMKAPPQSFDAFAAGLQELPNEVWEAGEPLWAMY